MKHRNNIKTSLWRHQFCFFDGACSMLENRISNQLRLQQLDCELNNRHLVASNLKKKKNSSFSNRQNLLRTRAHVRNVVRVRRISLTCKRIFDTRKCFWFIIVHLYIVTHGFICLPKCPLANFLCRGSTDGSNGELSVRISLP